VVAAKEGACDIDIVVLRTPTSVSKNPPVCNALELTSRVFDFMLGQLGTDDIMIGKLKGHKENVNLNFYHCPEKLTDFSLVFDTHQMKQWWEYGLRFARENSPLCKSIKNHT